MSVAPPLKSRLTCLILTNRMCENDRAWSCRDLYLCSHHLRALRLLAYGRREARWGWLTALASSQHHLPGRFHKAILDPATPGELSNASNLRKVPQPARQKGLSENGACDHQKTGKSISLAVLFIKAKAK